MIHIKDNVGVVRPPEPGEKFRMTDGSIYTVGRDGSLRAVRPDTQGKQLSPGKERRKKRRAAALKGE